MRGEPKSEGGEGLYMDQRGGVRAPSLRKKKETPPLPSCVSVVRHWALGFGVCLSQGLAIQVQPEFRIVKDAYPYISSRLLTDPSPELEAALQQLLFEPASGQARWDRLEQLLTQASGTADYDVGAAAHKFVDYLVSEKGAGVRAQLVDAVVQGADELGDEAMDLIDHVVRTRSLPNPDTLKSPRLATAANIATALVGNPSSFDVERLLPFAQKLANEPASRQAGIDAAAAISERAISRGIRRLFQVENSSVN